MQPFTIKTISTPEMHKSRSGPNSKISGSGLADKLPASPASPIKEASNFIDVDVMNSLVVVPEQSAL